MERFDVKRGLVKQVSENGGLAVLASEYFDDVSELSLIHISEPTRPY